MKAAFLHGPGDLRLEEVAEPALAADGVLLAIRACGICGSNLHGWHPGGRSLPAVPGANGHEVAGEVAAVGRAARGVKEGDRVCVELFETQACGRCRYCAAGAFTQCTTKRGLPVWGFAERLAVSAHGLYPIDAGLSFADASLVEPLACATHAVRKAGLEGGETVAVLGTGPTGLFVVAAAARLGAGRILATAKYGHQAALARRAGATTVVSSGDAEADERLLAAAGPSGIDVVFETVGGSAGTFAQAFRLVRPRGRVVVLGLFDRPLTIDSWLGVYKEIEISFALTYGHYGGRHDYEIALDWIRTGTLSVDGLVTHEFPLEEIARAFDVAGNKREGTVKVVVHSNS